MIEDIPLNEKSNHIHLISGGLDSAYSLLSKAKEFKKQNVSIVIYPIFFDYGHFSAEVEWAKVSGVIEFIRDFIKDTSMISNPIKIMLKSDLFSWCKNDSFMGKSEHLNPEIENRNMVLFSILASFLIACAEHQGIKSTEFIITSGFKEKEMLDSNRVFFDKISELLKKQNKGLTFYFDILSYMEREEVIKKSKRLLRGNEIDLKKFLKLTISCYHPIDGIRCGECSKCKSIAKN